MTRLRSVSLGVLIVFAVQAAPLGAQAPDTPPAPAAVPAVPLTSNDLTRIRRALDMDPAVRIDDEQLRFYMQVLAKQPSFAEFAKGYDFKYGPTRGGNPMSHNEFLAMVTPRELQSSGGITARETLEFALTNWVGQALVKKAFQELQSAKTEREIQDIRDRIERELALIKGASER